MNVQKSFISHNNANENSETAGTLFLVGTPIGNLEDMTYRAIRTLREADLIAAEDTRQTRKLLTHFEISTRLVSYHEHNKQASGSELIRLLEEGQQIALVSDAGLPAISDPGADLVRAAVERDINVVPIPGANAALSALIVSGLSTERFFFAGFPPRDKKSLNDWLDQMNNQEGTILCYESPHRIQKTLSAILQAWGNRRIVMARELTKRHEEIARGTVEECIAWLEKQPPLGEYCLLIEGIDAVESGVYGESGAGRHSDAAWWSNLELEAHVNHYESITGNRKEAMKRAASDRGMSKRDVYNIIMKKDD
ncbi:16S rRNA (cytidine(1402)-2'-O)-methyltransferase [Paenibacillus abyssi]|uniref:Ribosomal RNA small subunit methyltransferase I n=1 Tax=Paenibacillus abyssi TaxID=1340531 RepID=A0A917G5R5_9BACL|nr:16S rRNA (cytidine(1402)-2'-O)-methyltransferase [Paenibacillus abyssi]GGG24494.1 ribosomal RNA small subunit methyltransferase I [Paenibacillus abyssi]